MIAAWHVPAAYDYTLTHQVVHDVEHLSFVVVGLLVWIQLVDPARRRELSLPGSSLAIALFAAGQILADVLIFAMRPLYGSYAEQPGAAARLSPLDDQRLAGLVMMGEQLLTLGTFVALTLIAQHRRLFRPTEDERRVAASPAPSSFTFEPLFLALVAVAAVLYVRAARADRPPAWRIASSRSASS